MKYTVKMKNPKSGQVESYITEADKCEDLDGALELFAEGGYEIISLEPVEG